MCALKGVGVWGACLPALLCLGLGGGLAWSQDEGDDLPVYRMPEVVVTASPILERSEVDEFGLARAVVGEAQIEQLNAQDLSSALRRVPGVGITRYNPIGSYGGADGGSIYIRGKGAGRPGAEIATLFDGIPRSASVWSHPVLDVFSLDPAARIEIRKSPDPVGAGGNAYGTVNIVPKRRTEEGFETRFRTEFGEYRTAIGLAEHGGKVGDFDYYLTASRRQGDGHREGSDGRVQGLYGRAGYALSGEWDATLQAMHTDSRVHDPGAVDSGPRDQDPRFDTDTEFYLAEVSHDTGKLSGSLKVYFENGRMDWRQWNPPQESEGGETIPGYLFSTITDYENYGLRWKQTLDPRPGTRLVLGYDQDFYGGSAVEIHQDGSRGLGSDRSFLNRSPYLRASHRIPGWLELTPSAGIRFTDSRYFDSEWAWQFGLTGRLGNVRFYANQSRTFIYPGVNVVFFYEDIWPPQPDAWQDLEAERMDHYEIGGAGTIMPGLDLSVSFFYDEVEDALRFVSPPPPPPSFGNAGAYITRGVETSLTMASRDDLSLFAGLTLAYTSPAEVPVTPEWTVTGGANWRPIAPLHLSVDMTWQDEQYILNPRFAGPAAFESEMARVDRYFLLNARLGYQIKPAQRAARAEIFLAGENLTDEEYEYRPGYPMPGTNWMGGVDVRF